MKYDEYKTHPRILELRVTAYYNMLVQEYGVNRASNFLKTFCEMTYVDFQKINGIVNQYVKIRHLEKLNKTHSGACTEKQNVYRFIYNFTTSM